MPSLPQRRVIYNLLTGAASPKKLIEQPLFIPDQEKIPGLEEGSRDVDIVSDEDLGAAEDGDTAAAIQASLVGEEVSDLQAAIELSRRASVDVIQHHSLITALYQPNSARVQMRTCTPTSPLQD